MKYFNKVNKNVTTWGRGFFTSVLGTTVSIILTFGTSALIDHKMKVDVQRQTAMMVIHDIDKCVEQLEEMAKDEEEMNFAVQYVLAHQDQIASLPDDTLELAMDMFIDYGSLTTFDDAKENIFKSSQDIWSNLDNMAFIDNMEKFYRERREIERVLTSDPALKYPISYEEYCQMRINSSSDTHSLDRASILKEKLNDPKIRFFIDFSGARVRTYRYFAQQWRDISNRNKFIMDISDEELAEYIKNSQRSGISVNERDLVGQWERKSNGVDDIYYEFKDDNSFQRKRIRHFDYPIWSGVVFMESVYGGTWSIKDDTLLMVSDPKSAQVRLDTSLISYRPEMRDSVRNMIRRHMDVKENTEELRKEILEKPRNTFPVTTNKSRDKIEMVTSRSGDNVTTRYLKRVKNGDVFKK